MVGVAVVDFVFLLDELPRDATKYRTEEAVIVGGGCAANAAVAATRLGARVTLAGRVGDDLIGDLIVADLERDGVDTTLVARTPGAHSSYSSVYVDAGGERQIVNYRGTGLEDDLSWVSEVPAVDAVLVDTKWTVGATAALDLARERGVPGIVDAEPPMDTRLLERASHIAFSRHGLESLTGPAHPAAALEALGTRFEAWQCVTDGANGVYLTSDASVEHLPGFEVEVIDTLGAGDVWHGAFALRIAEGADERSAIVFANAVAALKCAAGHGRAGSPDRPAVEGLLAADH